MKKLFNASIVLALTSMLFFSCSKADELVVNDEDVLVKATLIAGNPQATPASKTQIDGTTPYWSVGDAIGVSDGATNQEFTTSITSPSTTASFSGETVSGELYAYYPYTSGGVSSSKVNIALPAEQNPTATSFDGRADVLVSKKFIVTPENTTVSGLQFKRLTSVLKVVIKNNGVLPAGEHPTFVSVEAGSNLIGTVQVDFADQSMSLPSGSTKVTANYTSATQFEIDGTNAAYLVVVPQTLAEGTTLTLKANTENYYIEKNITVPAGGIEILEGKITTLNIGMSNSTVTHHPAITVTSDNPVEADNLAGSYTINYTISDPLTGESISAASTDSWISNINVSTSGEVSFNVARQDYYAPARTGHITLSYKDAADVVVTVNQAKGFDPVINITSATPVKADNIASTFDTDSYPITYTITNPFTGGTLTASSTDSWISNISVNSTDGKISFDVDAQENNAAQRTGHITLTYKDANNNNAVVTSEVVDVIQRKGRILATLEVASNTSVSSPVDDNRNIWACSTDNNVELTISNSNNHYYIQAGTASKQHPQNLTLTLSGHSAYQIWAVSAWAAAESTAYTHISIGGDSVADSPETLANNPGNGGTSLSYENLSTSKSGDVVINIQKTKADKNHIYFNKLTILYDEKSFEAWLAE